MTLRVWDPFRDSMSLSDAMNRLFAESFVRPASTWGGNGHGYWFPIDIEETDNEYVVKASLPGYRPEDVNITTSGDTLTISGEYKGEEEHKESNYLLRERRFGSFSRTITLPVPFDSNQANARYEHGELVLTLPKAEEVRPRQIKIDVASQPQLSSTNEVAA